MSDKNESMRQAIINEDFKFLDDIKIHNLNGTLMLGDEELPYSVGHVIKESEFVSKWLMGFALGNSIGINYFDTNGWLALTNNGTRSLMVVDDNDPTQPLLVIKPLISHNLTQNEIYVLRRLNERLHSLSADTTHGSSPNASMGLSNGVVDMLDDVKATTLTDMIPESFYEKHGVNPAAEQKLYYTKDVINKGKRSLEDINKLRPIFYRLEEGKNLTKEEIAFVKEMTNNELVIENQPTNSKEESVEDKLTQVNDDPFSC